MLQGWLFLHGSFWTKERAKALLTSIPQASIQLKHKKINIQIIGANARLGSAIRIV